MNLFPACSIWWYGDDFKYLLHWSSRSEVKGQMAGMYIEDFFPPNFMFLMLLLQGTINWIVNLIV